MSRRIRWSVGFIPLVVILAVSCTSPRAQKLTKTPPPFLLTTDEHKNVALILERWEQWNAGVKRFDCRFKRWTYDSVFGPRNEAKFVDFGEIKYASPNCSIYRADTTENGGKAAPIEDSRAEQWIFDGKSVVEFNHVKRQVIEHKLPPEWQNQRLVDGPLAFGFPGIVFSSLWGFPTPPPPMFGSDAKKLQEQYYIREVTPATNRGEQVWLEAYPRFQQIACNLHHLQLIFLKKDMMPVAMKIVQPNGKDYVVYQFYDIVVNGPSASAGDDPFHPATPPGWRKIDASPLPTPLPNRP